MKIAVIQIKVKEEKRRNLEQAERMIREAAGQGAKLVALPEMFNCPYNSSYFPTYAEAAGRGETSTLLSGLSRELQLWIVGGSIPEREGVAIYNTSLVFNSSGEMVAKHRKMHLYDVELANGFTFKESEVLSPGNSLTHFETPWGKMGVLICYDIRFPEPARLLALEGVKVLVLPAAFNMTTGPAHWEPQMKIRALDNQFYVVAASPARDIGASYHAYGHSMIVSPWGEVLVEAGHEEEIIYSEIDLQHTEKIRKEFPLLKHRRTDIYDVISR